MSQDQHPVPTKSPDTKASLGWVRDAIRQVNLAWRLFWDQRVPLWNKVIPPAALAYVLFPLDLIPDMALGLGQLDDAAVVLLGIKLFIELSPPDVVREHLRALGAKVKDWRIVEDEDQAPDVIEGEYQLQEPKETGES